VVLTPWIAGGVVAALSALSLLLPFMQLTEARATDLLFAYGRRDPPRASPDVVHVDIDDDAIDLVGRWTWPRSTLAETIHAIDSFGPKVIALDILLDDPSNPAFDAGGKPIDHDGELTRTLAGLRARTVLAVNMTNESGGRRSELWEAEGGRGRWEAVLAALRKDVTLDARAVAKAADLDPRRAERVALRLREFKRIAIREVVDGMIASGEVDEARVVRAMVPGDLTTLGDFPERPLIRVAVSRALAIRALLGNAPAWSGDLPVPASDELRPPLAALSGVANGAGVVNADPDPDGRIRRIPLAWRFGDRLLPQFGLVAAAMFLDVPIDRIEIRPGSVRIGSVTLPTSDGRLLIPWPAFDPRFGAFGLQRQHRRDTPTAGHVGIGRIWNFRRKEAQLDAQMQERDRIAKELVRGYLPTRKPEDLDDPALVAEVRAELFEQAAFLLDEGGGAPDSPETIAFSKWRTLEENIPRAQRELNPVRGALTLALRDRLVFVGWTATGNLAEFYPTPVDNRTPGVVVHAMVANACLTGYAVREGALWIGMALTFALGAAAAWFATASGPRLSLLLALLLCVLYVAANTLLVFNALRIAIASAAPITGVFLSWAGATVARAVQERREKAQLRKQFGARISPQLFEFLVNNPDLIQLGGQEREVTSYFSDLAGFTTISEMLDSRTTVSILNRYMWAMNDELTKEFAYVNKFLGDGIMAVWGAFSHEVPHAERACRAALACMRRLDRLLTEPDLANLPRLSMRIGIATGVAIVGDCGAPPDLQDYTAIGNPVNLAARLESANKQFGTKILVNGRTRELLPAGFVTRPLGLVTVAGQDTPAEIHELLATDADGTAAQRALVATTAEAVELFRSRRLTEAREAWRSLAADPSQAKLARFYLTAIEQHLAHADEAFDGVLHLDAK